MKIFTKGSIIDLNSSKRVDLTISNIINNRQAEKTTKEPEQNISPKQEPQYDEQTKALIDDNVQQNYDANNLAITASQGEFLVQIPYGIVQYFLDFEEYAFNYRNMIMLEEQKNGLTVNNLLSVNAHITHLIDNLILDKFVDKHSNTTDTIKYTTITQETSKELLATIQYWFNKLADDILEYRLEQASEHPKPGANIGANTKAFKEKLISHVMTISNNRISQYNANPKSFIQSSLNNDIDHSMHMKYSFDIAKIYKSNWDMHDFQFWYVLNGNKINMKNVANKLIQAAVNNDIDKFKKIQEKFDSIGNDINSDNEPDCDFEH